MTVSDRDIWLSAAQMIKAHGDEAWDEAVTRYFNLKEAGDHQGMATWRRIARAIDELAHARPSEIEN